MAASQPLLSSLWWGVRKLSALHPHAQRDNGVTSHHKSFVLGSTRPGHPSPPFIFRRALQGLGEMGDLISSIAWYACCRVLFCSTPLICAMQGQAGRLGAPPIKTTSE
jgi:hypothetical protein